MRRLGDVVSVRMLRHAGRAEIPSDRRVMLPNSTQTGRQNEIFVRRCRLRNEIAPDGAHRSLRRERRSLTHTQQRRRRTRRNVQRIGILLGQRFAGQNLGPLLLLVVVVNGPRRECRTIPVGGDGRENWRKCGRRREVIPQICGHFRRGGQIETVLDG